MAWGKMKKQAAAAAAHSQAYGATSTSDQQRPIMTQYELQDDGAVPAVAATDTFVTEDGDEMDEQYDMSLTELLYSSSSFHAIAKPGK
jgi:ketosteroid isomerase-like protein